MNAGEIERRIRSRLPDAVVHVRDTTGTGDHFEAVVVSARFAGKSRVEQHQLVYEALGAAMDGPIHAFSLHTYTPEQWREMQ